VVDAVRKSDAKRQDSKADRKLVEGSRWLMLKNRENVEGRDRVKLRRFPKLAVEEGGRHRLIRPSRLPEPRSRRSQTPFSTQS
jgi:hypothetical protein